jgi:hypothetical protein
MPSRLPTEDAKLSVLLRNLVSWGLCSSSTGFVKRVAFRHESPNLSVRCYSYFLQSSLLTSNHPPDILGNLNVHIKAHHYISIYSCFIFDYPTPARLGTQAGYQGIWAGGYQEIRKAMVPCPRCWDKNTKKLQKIGPGRGS